MSADEDYHSNYQKLLRFLGRKPAHGFVFAIAEDKRMIEQINSSLQNDLLLLNQKTIAVLYLDMQSDQSLYYQMEQAAATAEVLLIANLFYIISDTTEGLNQLQHLNFAREEILNLPAAILFWIDLPSLHILSNQAPDLFSRRSFSVIHFSGQLQKMPETFYNNANNERFISKEDFEQTEARIASLENRLKGAEVAGYNQHRLAREIALPLAKEYAAIDLKKEAIGLLEKYTPYTDVNDVESLQLVSDIYITLYDLDKAADCINQVIDLLEKLLEANPQTEVLIDGLVIAYGKLGNVYDEQGKYNKAIEFYQRAIELSTKSKTIGYIDITALFNNLGLSYYNKGEYDKAINYFQKVLSLMLHEFGEVNRESIKVNSNLGTAYSKKGEYDKAIEYLMKAFELSKRLNVEEHLDDAVLLNNLGLIYNDKGEYIKAIEYFEKALIIDKKLHGENNTEVAARYNNLGGVYRQKGEYDKAIEYYKEALKLYYELCGEMHPHIATTLNNFGAVYRSMGENDKAIEYYNKALAIDKKFHGENHPQIAIYNNNIGLAYNSKGESDKAIDYYQAKISILYKIWISHGSRCFYKR